MSTSFHVEQPDGIDRRSFVRRLFAIGAGIAVGGEPIRRVELIVPPEPQMSGRALLTIYEQGRIPVTLADWDALLHEDYMRALIVEAYSLETPFLEKLRAPRPLPIVASSRRVQPPGVRGRSLVDDLLELNRG